MVSAMRRALTCIGFLYAFVIVSSMAQNSYSHGPPVIVVRSLVKPQSLCPPRGALCFVDDHGQKVVVRYRIPGNTTDTVLAWENYEGELLASSIFKYLNVRSPNTWLATVEPASDARREVVAALANHEGERALVSEYVDGEWAGGRVTTHVDKKPTAAGDLDSFATLAIVDAMIGNAARSKETLVIASPPGGLDYPIPIDNRLAFASFLMVTAKSDVEFISFVPTYDGYGTQYPFRSCGNLGSITRRVGVHANYNRHILWSRKHRPRVRRMIEHVNEELTDDVIDRMVENLPSDLIPSSVKYTPDMSWVNDQFDTTVETFLPSMRTLFGSTLWKARKFELATTLKFRRDDLLSSLEAYWRHRDRKEPVDEAKEALEFAPPVFVASLLRQELEGMAWPGMEDLVSRAVQAVGDYDSSLRRSMGLPIESSGSNNRSNNGGKRRRDAGHGQGQGQGLDTETLAMINGVLGESASEAGSQDGSDVYADGPTTFVSVAGHSVDGDDEEEEEEEGSDSEGSVANDHAARNLDDEHSVTDAPSKRKGKSRRRSAGELNDKGRGKGRGKGRDKVRGKKVATTSSRASSQRSTSTRRPRPSKSNKSNASSRRGGRGSVERKTKSRPSKQTQKRKKKRAVLVEDEEEEDEHGDDDEGHDMNDQDASSGDINNDNEESYSATHDDDDDDDNEEEEEEEGTEGNVLRDDRDDFSSTASANAALTRPKRLKRTNKGGAGSRSRSTKKTQTQRLSKNKKTIKRR